MKIALLEKVLQLSTLKKDCVICLKCIFTLVQWKIMVSGLNLFCSVCLKANNRPPRKNYKQYFD